MRIWAGVSIYLPICSTHSVTYAPSSTLGNATDPTLLHASCSIIRLTDHALAAVSTNCTRLATLQIGGCKGLTDKGIDAFAKKVASNREQCASLVKFSMMNCSQLTNASLCSVAEHLTDLRDLCIYGCYR